MWITKCIILSFVSRTNENIYIRGIVHWQRRRNTPILLNILQVVRYCAHKRNFVCSFVEWKCFRSIEHRFCRFDVCCHYFGTCNNILHVSLRINWNGINCKANLMKFFETQQNASFLFAKCIKTVLLAWHRPIEQTTERKKG